LSAPVFNASNLAGLCWAYNPGCACVGQSAGYYASKNGVCFYTGGCANNIQASGYYKEPDGGSVNVTYQDKCGVLTPQNIQGFGKCNGCLIDYAAAAAMAAAAVATGQPELLAAIGSTDAAGAAAVADTVSAGTDVAAADAAGTAAADTSALSSVGAASGAPSLSSYGSLASLSGESAAPVSTGFENLATLGSGVSGSAMPSLGTVGNVASAIGNLTHCKTLSDIGAVATLGSAGMNIYCAGKLTLGCAGKVLGSAGTLTGCKTLSKLGAAAGLGSTASNMICSGKFALKCASSLASGVGNLTNCNNLKALGAVGTLACVAGNALCGSSKLGCIGKAAGALGSLGALSSIGGGSSGSGSGSSGSGSNSSSSSPFITPIAAPEIKAVTKAAPDDLASLKQIEPIAPVQDIGNTITNNAPVTDTAQMNQGQNMPSDIPSLFPPAMASGGSTNSFKSALCCYTPSWVTPERPTMLHGNAPQGCFSLAHLRQIAASPVPVMAKGGLPDKYKEAAPEGHNPEFITGLTGYYAHGRGTGQSDDIPAMLHDGDYVMDAETVSSLGDGSSLAGKRVLDGFMSKVDHHKYATGGGVVPAKIADGEYVFPASFVTAIGKGDNKRGSEILDGLREKLREHKRSAPTDKIPPKAKSPLAYMTKE
jgi:hypothetical protein